MFCIGHGDLVDVLVLDGHAALDTELFFFSSRRRHTRSLCDWSLDVCSSDLFIAPNPALITVRNGLVTKVESTEGGGAVKRSEERRVGKECRPRWSAHHYK